MDCIEQTDATARTDSTQRVHLGHVFSFLILTFGLSWGFDLLVALTVGQAVYLASGLNPMGMFVPAFSALLLQLFAFKDSLVYFRTYREKPRWIFHSFLLLTVLNGVITLLAFTTSIRTLILQGVAGILGTLWTFAVFYIYGQSSAESIRRAGLQIGNKDLAVRFIAGVVLFLLIQAVLNGLFGLGEFPGVRENVGGVPVSRGLYPFAAAAFLLISIIGVPLSGLAAVFGEEYGWRGFLHDELVKCGPRLGVFLVGSIWGIWHFPIILSGVHTYPATATGLLLGFVFFVLTGFVFGYAVMKTQSIWVAAFMHGVMNSVYAFVLNYLMYPGNKVFSFGLGIYGLICLAAVVLAMMRDPIWRNPRK
jgi:membrane protease YdiL (CAAX protease family)